MPQTKAQPKNESAKLTTQDFFNLAIDNDQVEVALTLLSLPGITPNVQTPNARIPLSYAIQEGHDSLVKAILAVDGVDVNCGFDAHRLSNINTALIAAIEKSDLMLVKQLVADCDARIVYPLNEEYKQPLLCAIESSEGNTSILEFLLSKDIDLSQQDAQGIGLFSLCLQSAIERDKLTIFELFLSKNYNDLINAPCYKSTNPLMLACHQNKLLFVERLLQIETIDVNAINSLGNTALMIACFNGHDAIVKSLLKYGAVNTGIYNNNGDNVLSELIKQIVDAAKQSQNKPSEKSKLRRFYRIIDALIEHTPDFFMQACQNKNLLAIVHTDSMSTNPSYDFGISLRMRALYAFLRFKVLCDDMIIIHQNRGLLVNKDINHIFDEILGINLSNVNIKTFIETLCNQTPSYASHLLIYAMSIGNEILTELLLSSESLDFSHSITNGMTPLSWAAKNGYTRLFRALFESIEPDINHIYLDGKTLIYMAAEQGHDAILGYILLKPTVNINIESQGISALIVATMNNHTSTVNLLLANGASLNTQSKKTRMTALMYAAKNGCDELVRIFMMQPSIDTRIKDKQGQTAIILATKNDHTKTALLMIEHSQDVFDDLVINNALLNQLNKTSKKHQVHSANPLHKTAQFSSMYRYHQCVNALKNHGKKPLFSQPKKAKDDLQQAYNESPHLFNRLSALVNSEKGSQLFSKEAIEYFNQVYIKLIAPPCYGSSHASSIENLLPSAPALRAKACDVSDESYKNASADERNVNFTGHEETIDEQQQSLCSNVYPDFNLHITPNFNPSVFQQLKKSLVESDGDHQHADALNNIENSL